MILYIVGTAILLVTNVPTALGNPVGGSGMPQVTAMDVKCGRTGMNVHVTFDLPFRGVIYSKGHYSDLSCQYFTEKDSGSLSFSFIIPSDSCGTLGQFDNPDKEMFFSNIVIFQNDPIIQEIWDQARNVRCTWRDNISKSVDSKSFKVEAPKQVTIDFDSRAVNSLMQIQRGKSPFSYPATGYIYAEEDSSVVIYLEDSDNKLDANPVSCEASSTKNGRVKLIDRNGCVLRPKLMSGFTKIKNPKDVKASLMMFANLKALEVGRNFKMTCHLEVCDDQCLEPCALGPYDSLKKRKKRAITELIEVEGGAIVIAKEDKKDDKSSEECSLSNIILPIIMILLLICSILCCIACYLAYKLHLLKDRINIYSKH